MTSTDVFNDLNEIERAMLELAAIGNELIMPVSDQQVTREEMEAWGVERTVRAVVLRHLLTDPLWPITSKGIKLRGIRITGSLNLESTTLRCPISFNHCLVDSPDQPSDMISLDYVSGSRIAFINCHLPGIRGKGLSLSQTLDLSSSVLQGELYLVSAKISSELTCAGTQIKGVGDHNVSMNADHLTVGDGLILNEGFTTAGAVCLSGANITGILSCRGAQINGSNPDGWAFRADRLKVDGSVYLSQGFAAAGGVSLHGASITGQFSCRSANLKDLGKNGASLFADRLTVGRSVLLDEGFTAAGVIRLLGANITGQLTCKGAQLVGADSDGRTVIADRLTIGGSVFLSDGFSATGVVQMTGARIEGQLSCSGQFMGEGKNGVGLAVNRATVGADVILGEDFCAMGAADLSSSVIGGSLRVVAAKLGDSVALVAIGLVVRRDLEWHPMGSVRGIVDLRRATVSYLVDDGDDPGRIWPPNGNLRLDGFVYEGFGGDNRGTWQTRLRWVRLQYEKAPDEHETECYFVLGPYEQLARVYRTHGQETEARKVTIAKHNDLRKYGSLSRTSWLGSLLLDKTIKHGYRPLRAITVLAFVYMATFGVLLASEHYGVHTPNNNSDLIVAGKDAIGLSPMPSERTCTSTYPCFSPAGLALDTVLPIVNVHQSENWRPNRRAPFGTSLVVFLIVATLLGWAFTTLAVVGYTGLVRRD